MATNLQGSVDNLPATEPKSEDLEKLRERYKSAGQSHVFTFYDTLDVPEKAALFAQLSNIDVERFSDIIKPIIHPSPEPSEKPIIKPLPPNAISSIVDPNDDATKWYNHGLELIAQNKVAVVLLAGGQGTRLGSSAPKGCFDIGLESKKSLFQVQAERVFKLQKLAHRVYGKDSKVTPIIPWYIMTSSPTLGPTEKFFKEKNYFGLNKQNVVIFKQGELPCMFNDGKIIMEEKSKVAISPNGNGGIYQALFQSGVAKDMEDRGIKHIHVYCVDNCLVKVADPTFIGLSALRDVYLATKAVRKRDEKESVGLIVQRNTLPGVVEYSELDPAMAVEKDFNDPEVLKFRLANIVNHYYSSEFLLGTLKCTGHDLPYHVARKKIPCIDLKSGEMVKPDKPNGCKLEQFVFDCFQDVPMDKFVCLEVKREEEFSPLKNARGTGEDDPDTCKKDLLAQWYRWLKAAGAADKHTNVELSPLISYGGEDLEGFMIPPSAAG